MKKTLLLFTLLSAFTISTAQETGSRQRKNDILADPVLLIAVPMANISYERLLNENMGLGLNAMVTLSSDTENFKQFSPYFRYYLGKKYAAGFFLEGFVPVTMQQNEIYNYNYDDVTNTMSYRNKVVSNFTTVGIGFGIGGKWVIKNRLVLEASGGIARRIGDVDNDEVGPVTGKIMGGVGYRF
ncbi:DUF3575 domain-containing protein [uncultured Chryseobacterium sp.]|uniref:DUF3575 domain-containing protein n=1 Tax=uncultured Chryseobacterium sp. TaxID=259322 RepID=UPI0025E1185F|nr:DUF3575 domain-containing protein [uncultured Chryseobacterium sp.]